MILASKGDRSVLLRAGGVEQVLLARRPRGSPQQTPVQVEQEIVELCKALADEGLDAGAHTIAYHVTKRHGTGPSVATI